MISQFINKFKHVLVGFFVYRVALHPEYDVFIGMGQVLNSVPVLHSS